MLDLGAGTGKLTAVLLDLGLDVVAVEPSEQMRAHVPALAEVARVLRPGGTFVLPYVTEVWRSVRD